MESFSFVVKTILFTVALIWICQFRVENRTVERHFLDFVRQSNITAPIHKIAFGSRKAANDGWAGFKNLVGLEHNKAAAKSTLKASTFQWTVGDENSTQDSSTVDEDDRDSEESE